DPAAGPAPPAYTWSHTRTPSGAAAHRGRYGRPHRRSAGARRAATRSRARIPARRRPGRGAGGPDRAARRAARRGRGAGHRAPERAVPPGAGRSLAGRRAGTDDGGVGRVRMTAAIVLFGALAACSGGGSAEQDPDAIARLLRAVA